MDLSKIKNLVKQNGDKFIFVENGEPEVVMMSFGEYQKLSQRDPNIRMPSELSESPKKFYADHSDDRFGAFGPHTEFKETEFMAPVVAESAGLPRYTTSTADIGGKNEVVEDVIRGLPVRLEDIRLEDLPI